MDGCGKRDLAKERGKQGPKKGTDDKGLDFSRGISQKTQKMKSLFLQEQMDELQKAMKSVSGQVG